MARRPKPHLRAEIAGRMRAVPRSSSTDLARHLLVTPQTVRRLLDELPRGSVLAAGRSNATRYALRRPLRGSTDDIPVYAVDAQGKGRSLGSLALVQPEGTLQSLRETPWPLPDDAREGWWEGLPYPLYAMRSQGYLGRQFARAEHHDLGVPDDPESWNDEEILWALSRRGSDTPGNLIVGEEAYRRWLDHKVSRSAPLAAGSVGDAYCRRAVEAVDGFGGGSSAAGEFPKFTASRTLEGARTPHVIVKFSGAEGSPSEQRWADLLVCEHLALACVERLPGVLAARSRVLVHGGRTFIEVERFDRTGDDGRLSLCSLDVIHGAFIGSRSTTWPDLAASLHEAGLLAEADRKAIDQLWWYGRLIANTDMHLGNISFHVDSTFRLAPTYDMLPMAYAPLAGGEVPSREFLPSLPRPEERDVWQTARKAAEAFWRDAAADTRISDAYRSTCRANLAKLERAADMA